MKKINIITVNAILFFILTAFTCFDIFAQKLPNLQQTSMRAPANIKIDGLATEWNNQYQAYNKTVEFFYTIANDNNNIYLVIHAEKSRIIEKIVEGGVSFSVNNSGKLNDKKNIVVLFPLMELPTCKGVLITAGKSLTGKTITDKHENLTKALDSVALLNRNNSIEKANKELIEKLKEIKISGIDAITDTVAGVTEMSPYYRNLPLRSHYLKFISINNRDNIKAMIQFDNNGELTYELAIPAKYLGLSVDDPQKFYYNITVNGRGEDSRPGNTVAFDRKSADHHILDQDLEYPTSFWGDYTFAKK